MIANRLRRWIFVFAVVLAVAHPTAAFAQVNLPQESNQGSWQNAKGPAVASRAPGLWVRAGISGPVITQTNEDVLVPHQLTKFGVSGGVQSEVLHFPPLPEVWMA